MKHRQIFFLSFLLIFIAIAHSSFGFSPSNQLLKDTTCIFPDSLGMMADTSNKVDDLAGINDTVVMFSNKPLDEKANADRIIKDSPVATMLDSLVNISFFTNENFITDTAQLNIYQYCRDVVPAFPDSVYEARISMLSGQTPFDMTYNKTVRGFIELYSVRKRNLTSRMLGLSEVYFPMFEEILDAYGLPLELKYLAMIESALNPTAGSRAGAKGLWQFMYGTGKGYGLGVTSYVDDRYDPYKATIAACRHLRDLYNIYQDWSLVLAAYNSGAGNVNKAIRRAGGVKDYYAIWRYLPKETRGYVPAFVAVNYVMNFSAEHNLYPVDPGILYNGIDTVHVYDVLSFDQISEFLNIPVEDLRFLNPSFKLGVIPANQNNQYILRLPRKFTGEFVSNEKEIYNFKSKKGIEREKLLVQIKQARESSIHIVKKGESLGVIARKYHISVNNLKSWNNLKGTSLFPGQKLAVFADAVNVEKRTHKTNPVVQQQVKESLHTVKRGENLGLIAKKYGCTVSDLQTWNKLKSSNLKVNQRLLVSAPAKEDKGESVVDEINRNNTEKTKYLYHTVKAGDTLWDIARQYDGVTVNEIKKLNNISNAAKLKPGQKLKVAIVS
jgi:membrane-bound lytic murein transglycosylase D